ncbi:MAG: glycoside hydrolase family 2, partial [Bacteroidales bacterium]|nr:glycoside hydrolase family 2 [Bacteroidales bacterium]
NSKKVWEKSVRNVRVPEDGVACDLLTADFFHAATDVQFLALKLTGADGKTVSENFYWRSNNGYEGPKTLTGPCTAGFQSLNNMKQVSLKYTTKVIPQKAPCYLVEVTVKNNSKNIAFFNQLHLFGTDNQPIRGAFYSDNFFTLLPGESKTVIIDCPLHRISSKELTLKVSGWNVPEQVLKLKKL